MKLSKYENKVVCKNMRFFSVFNERNTTIFQEQSVSSEYSSWNATFAGIIF